MAIAGFDPSLTNFGWVILDENKPVLGSVLDMGTFKTDTGDGLRVQRMIMQRERVRNLLEKWKVEFVSMEAPYLMDFSTEILFALNQFVHEVFLNMGTYVLYIQPQSLKKYAIPSMNPNDVGKPHMTRQAKTELGLQRKRINEHVADAFFAGKLGHRFYNSVMNGNLSEDELSEWERDFMYGKHLYTRGAKKGITEYTGVTFKENDQFFDYKKHKRNTETIIKEIKNGGEKKGARTAEKVEDPHP